MTRTLPKVVTNYIDAVNRFDGDAVMATFADDALVNDIRREFWGVEAIRRWVEREIIADKVTMEVAEVIDHYGDAIVIANIDGNYDKTALPDGLVLTHYFTVRNERIVTLIILQNVATPPVITRYLQAADASDFEALASCFTSDGTVVDEETTYRGHDEIVGWRESTGAKWEYTSSVKSIEPISDTECLAVVHVEGNFPGGVADLRYRFLLADGLISALTIVQ